MRRIFFKNNQGLVFLVLFLAAFLRFYRLSDLMPFIGDQGWFFLSARDLVLFGKIPLVGIASSHTWLHQGPLWTYILSFLLLVFNFNPVAAGYFVAFFAVVTVFLAYKIFSILYSKRLGLIMAVLFATSPLVVIHSRLPYHTSFIPITVLLLLFSFYKLIDGKVIYFPFIIFVLAVLYNFELATIPFWGVLFFVLLWGFKNKEKWIKKVFSGSTVFYSVLLFILPMLSILIYDFRNGFPQSLKFAGWILYRIAGFLGLLFKPGLFLYDLNGLNLFVFEYSARLIFSLSGTISVFVIATSILFFAFSFYRDLKKDKKVDKKTLLVLLFVYIPLLSFLINRTFSEAYLVMLFPGILFLVSFLLDRMMSDKKLKALSVIGLCLFVFSNFYFLLKENYLMGKSVGYGPSYEQRVQIAREIIKIANGEKYNLYGRGEGSKFASFTANYEYLLWRLGSEPVKTQANLLFYIEEKDGSIILDRKIK